MVGDHIMSEQELNIETMASQLAREIARNLVPIGQIQERYRIDEEQYQRVVGSNFFKQRLEEELELWNASTPKAINERISAKTATMIEESIPEVFDLIHDKKQPMAAKIEALKWAANVAGLVKRDSGGQTTGERVRFNIYIGDKLVNIDKTMTDPPTLEGTAVLLDKQPV
jgi:hypothetical protein